MKTFPAANAIHKYQRLWLSSISDPVPTLTGLQILPLETPHFAATIPKCFVVPTIYELSRSSSGRSDFTATSIYRLGSVPQSCDEHVGHVLELAALSGESGVPGCPVLYFAQ